jgi:hypothetical protein
MTLKQKISSLKATFLTLVLLLSFSLVSFINASAQAVPIDRKDPIAIYFKYGSATIDKNIDNAVASFTISNTKDASSMYLMVIHIEMIQTKPLLFLPVEPTTHQDTK